jgi:hypothetical protein
LLCVAGLYRATAVADLTPDQPHKAVSSAR